MKEESKSNRILSLYDGLCRGWLINKADWAEDHHVCERSVQRDIGTIQAYLEERNAERGQQAAIIYDRKRQGYRISNLENTFLNEGELLEICKILIESRAFKKPELQSLLARLLQSVMSDEGKARIHEHIKNEIFNYLDPSHEGVDPDVLWTIAEAIKYGHILEISYYKMTADKPVQRRIRPVGILFSEYYFYVMGIIDSDKGQAYFEKNGPAIYRIDRIRDIRDTEELFSLPYGKRFKEGEYKNRVQFMYGGQRMAIQFRYYGPSIEAVLDRLPTASITKEEEGCYTVRAEILGSGILMWLLSQGSKVEVLSPESLRKQWIEEARAILARVENGKKK